MRKLSDNAKAALLGIVIVATLAIFVPTRIASELRGLLFALLILMFLARGIVAEVKSRRKERDQ